MANEYVKEDLFSKESYRYLYDAKETRNDSSYTYSMTFSEETAEELILQAEKFIDEVETSLNILIITKLIDVKIPDYNFFIFLIFMFKSNVFILFKSNY